MANNFQIAITADDRASAVVKKIAKAFTGLGRFASSTGKSLGAMGRDLGAWGKRPGLKETGKSLLQVGKAAKDVAGDIGSLIAPMTAFIGIGSVAAIGALTIAWGGLGAEIGRTADGLGMSVQQLQSLEGAARMAGTSQGVLASSMRSFGDTLQDALVGRNGGAFGLLQQLGIRIQKTKDGAVDTSAALFALADKLNAPGLKGHVQTQDYIAAQLGVTELLPFLRKGEAGIREFQATAAKFAMSDAEVAKAAQFQQSMAIMALSIGKLRNTIGGALMPALQPLIEQLTLWIGKNQELIGQRVGEFARNLADWLRQIDFKHVGQDVLDLIGDIKGVVGALGGFKHAAIALGIAMNAGLIADIVKLGWYMGKLAWVGVPAVSGALASLPAAFAGGALKMGIFAEGLAGITGGVPLLSAALTVLSDTFVAVGVAIEATPVGWIITAIGAVAAGAYEIHKHWDGIADFFGKLWRGVKDAFEQNWSHGIVSALLTFNPIGILAETMNGLIKWLTGVDLFDAGACMVGSLVRGIKSISSMLPDKAQKLLGLDAIEVGAPKAPNVIAPKPVSIAVPTSPAMVNRSPIMQRSASIPAGDATASSASVGVGATLDWDGGLSLQSAFAGLDKLISTLSEAIQRLTDAIDRVGNGWQIGDEATGNAVGFAAVPALSSAASSAKSRTPLGIRQNNPGDLRCWSGVPSINGFAQFATPLAGLEAMASNLRDYDARGVHTLAGMVQRWAPASDANDVRAYVADLSRQMAVAPEGRLDLTDPKTLAATMRAMIRHENGVQPYSDELINQAAGASAKASPQNSTPQRVQVSVAFANTPPGTRATVASSDGVDHSVRVGYSLQGIG